MEKFNFIKDPACFGVIDPGKGIRLKQHYDTRDDDYTHHSFQFSAPSLVGGPSEWCTFRTDDVRDESRKIVRTRISRAQIYAYMAPLHGGDEAKQAEIQHQLEAALAAYLKAYANVAEPAIEFYTPLYNPNTRSAPPKKRLSGLQRAALTAILSIFALLCLAYGVYRFVERWRALSQ